MGVVCAGGRRRRAELRASSGGRSAHPDLGIPARRPTRGADLGVRPVDGVYVRNLDADDQLTAKALARDIAVLEEHPAVGWTTSRVLDLLDDGSTVSFDGDPEPGRLPRGSAYAFWAEHRRPGIHPATLCVRRPLLALLGGWMALPASGDTGLLLGLDALADGWFTGDTGLMYRKHPGQITTHPNHRAGAEWEARMSLIEEHAKALHAWAGLAIEPEAEALVTALRELRGGR